MANVELELGEALDGARLSGMLPYLERELTSLADACIARVDRLLQDGKLTPDMAQQAWVELLGYRRLLRRFQQKVRIGVSLGEQHVALLNGPAGER